MSYLQTIRYGGTQSIDEVIVLNAAMPPPPPRVSRPVSIARRTFPSQFHRQNADPQSTPHWGYQMPAGVFVRATPPARSGSRYPEADSRRQTRPRGYDFERQQILTQFHPAEETTVLMPPPTGAGRQRRRLRLVLQESATEFEIAVAASADEYDMRTTGVSESAIEKLERVEIVGNGGGAWKQGDCCTICLEEMGCGEGKVIRLDCKHEFHEICLISWLRKSNCCPLCRFQIPDS